MTIYLIRHGETDWNRRLKIQGQADIPLNGNGRRQAEALAAQMSDIPADAAYTSPLARAAETAEIFLAGRQGCPLHTDPLLKEISYGVREGQPLRLIHRCPFLRLYNYFEHPEKYVPPRGGETIRQLKARSRAFLLQAVSAYGAGDSNIMVFTHGAFIKAAVSVVNKLPDGRFWDGSEAENCSVTAVRFAGGKFELL